MHRPCHHVLVLSSGLFAFLSFFFFFFNDTATTEIYTLSLHDALPNSGRYLFHTCAYTLLVIELKKIPELIVRFLRRRDRKSTRLNSSHVEISYAVFCLKKKTTYT